MIPISVLHGLHLSLIPLKAENFAELHRAASDPKIWEQHPEPTRYRAEVFQNYFDSAIKSRGAFLIVDAKTKSVIGSSRFYNYDASKKEICIGYTFLKCEFWGGVYNRELKNLMLTHAFQFVERVKFEVGEHNLRSQKALQNIGAVLVGEMHETAPNGEVQKHLVFEICR